jgi:hypothetical protein
MCVLGGVSNQQEADYEAADMSWNICFGCVVAQGVVLAELRLLEMGVDHAGLSAYRPMGEG